MWYIKTNFTYSLREFKVILKINNKFSQESSQFLILHGNYAWLLT